MKLGHLRFIKAVSPNWPHRHDAPLWGKESETALAEPFEAPALAAFPQHCRLPSAPVHLIGAASLTPAAANLPLPAALVWYWPNDKEPNDHL